MRGCVRSWRSFDFGSPGLRRRKMKPEMRPLIAKFILIGLLTALPGQVWAGGARGGERAVAAATRSAVSHTLAHGGTPLTRSATPYRHYYYYPSPYGFSGYYRQPIVVISPMYYPFYVPPVIVTSSPFYCLAHQAGYISRAGMLDHLSGTHRIPLETAASACPEATESCVVDGY